MKTFLLQFTLAGSICFLFAHPSRGTGNDSPTGVTGTFSGTIATAGSYDPYTGNATRMVEDMTVAGSVGAYPLKWTRVLNTRNFGGVTGLARGGWTHSYDWHIYMRSSANPDHWNDGTPDYYSGPDGIVYYPDGRQVELSGQPGGTYWGSSEPEKSIWVKPTGSGNYDLWLTDGGKVQFEIGPYLDGTVMRTALLAKRIVDPYGVTTTFTRDSAGRLVTIADGAGRYLQINYTNSLITSVQAFDGRGNLMETVSYSYTPMGDNYLTGVNYDDGTHATYTYQASMVGPAYLIHTCDDVRFGGAMSKIEYVYMPDGGGVDFGQIKGEKYPGSAAFVSQVSYPAWMCCAWNDPAGYVRTETRADGATRTFQYTIGGGNMQSYTDFKNHTSFLSYPYDPSILPLVSRTFTDARQNTTTTYRETNIGAVKKITHPDTSFVQFEYTDNANPYYLASQTDELGRPTYFDRDANNRIRQTRYPDLGFEQFTYNSFGQVLTHLMTRGGTETFTCDDRGLKTTSYPPPTESDPDPWNHPTRYNYYQSGPNADRLLNVVDPRGNATWFEYNLRGQVTKVTHQDTSYTQSSYNADGTLAWTADENHPGAASDPNQRTRYTYDEYKRVLTVTNPLNETITNSYSPWSGIGSLSHTTASVYWTTTPLGKTTHFDYDQNFRRTVMHQAPGTADDAWTWSDYDEVGNLSWTRDPRNHTTYFAYDNRNRQTTMTDALDIVTTTNYDTAGNKNWVKRATGVGGFESTIQYPEYDQMNRLKHQIDEIGVHSYMGYDHAGNLTDSWDGNGNRYQYGYDFMNRKTSATYPDNSHEDFSYDTASNLATHTNRQGAVQTFAPYDNRNRPTSFSWSGGTPWQSFEYDLTSKVTALHNAEADIVNTYDAANRKTSETETIKSYGLWAQRSTAYQYDADGSRSRLIYRRATSSSTAIPSAISSIISSSTRPSLAGIIILPWSNMPTMRAGTGQRARCSRARTPSTTSTT